MSRKIVGGRSTWRSAGKITITEANYGEKLFVIESADLMHFADRTEFEVTTRHQTATDIEHDASYLAMFKGAGLQFKSISGKRVRFTGVILTAQHYPEDFVFEDGVSLKDLGLRFELDEIEACTECVGDGSHLLVPYLPPRVKFQPRLCEIEVSFYEKKDDS